MFCYWATAESHLNHKTPMPKHDAIWILTLKVAQKSPARLPDLMAAPVVIYLFIILCAVGRDHVVRVGACARLLISANWHGCVPRGG